MHWQDMIVVSLLSVRPFPNGLSKSDLCMLAVLGQRGWCVLLASMSGRGSSQEVVYRKVGGNMAGASTLFSASTVAIWGTRPTHT